MATIKLFSNAIILSALVAICLSGCYCNRAVQHPNVITARQSQTQNSIGYFVLVRKTAIGDVAASYGTYQIIGQKQNSYYVSTAFHVVKQAAVSGQVRIINQYGDLAQICSFDQSQDWAIVKFKKQGNRKPLKLAKAKNGQQALLIGTFPQFSPSGTAKIYASYWSGNVVNNDFDGFVIFNGGAIPGNSGGPLLNKNGQVIGILSGFKGAYGVPFATCALFIKPQLLQQQLNIQLGK